MRSDDGNHKISLHPTSGVHIASTASVAITAASGVSIAANQNFTGTVTIAGELIVNGIHFTTHVHSGILPGGANTAAPVAGS